MTRRMLLEQELFAITPHQAKPTFQHWANICTSLRHLGLEHFLAKGYIELGAGDDADKIVWETDLEGKIQHIKDLEPFEAERVRHKISFYGEQIDLETQRLLKSDKEEERNQGKILREIGGPPDETFIFVVGGQPVIAGWGVREDDTGPVADVVWLGGRGPTKGDVDVLAEKIVPPEVPARRSGKVAAKDAPQAPTEHPDTAKKPVRKAKASPDHEISGWLKALLLILIIVIVAIFLWLVLRQCSNVKRSSQEPSTGLGGLTLPFGKQKAPQPQEAPPSAEKGSRAGQEGEYQSGPSAEPEAPSAGPGDQAASPDDEVPIPGVPSIPPDLEHKLPGGSAPPTSQGADVSEQGTMPAPGERAPASGGGQSMPGRPGMASQDSPALPGSGPGSPGPPAVPPGGSGRGPWDRPAVPPSDRTAAIPPEASAQRPETPSKLVKARVLEPALIELSLDPPDATTRWKLVPDPDLSPELRGRVEKQIYFYDTPNAHEATGGSVRLKMAPFLNGPTFKASVLATDSAGRTTVYELTVGGE